MKGKRGMQLDRVVLLGRTFDEYRQFFALEPEALRGKRILDIASGVSSFRAEAAQRGFDVTAFDPIYELTADEIARRCVPDLEHVYRIVDGLPTYVWKNYRDRDHMREFRDKAWRTFLPDFKQFRGVNYVAGGLPKLPFADDSFDVCLVSYFLFVYEEQFAYEFHRDSVLEMMRVTRGEARIYPTVTFEAEPSAFLGRLENDPLLGHLRFEEIKTSFEFLRNSNSYLRITAKRG